MLVRESSGSARTIVQLSRLKCCNRLRFSASPELSRMITSILGLAQEQACAILEQARRPVRLVPIKMESCTLFRCRVRGGKRAAVKSLCFLADSETRRGLMKALPALCNAVRRWQNFAG